MIGAWIPWTDSKKSHGCTGYLIEENGCHTWTGSRHPDGYARGWADGSLQMVYRVRYEREIGPIPKGMDLDHLCNNGPEGCCNPHHCRPATRRENVLRGKGAPAQHARQTHCKHGHDLEEKIEGDRTRRFCRTCSRLWWRDYRRKRQSVKTPEDRAKAAAYARLWRARKKAANG